MSQMFKKPRPKFPKNYSDKENIMPNPTYFATPSEEDDFDDDDDELLIAASQQVEKKLALKKVPVGAPNIHQLQGEVSILRDQNTRLSREKEQIHFKQLEDIKNIEVKFKKELENYKSKLEFKERDLEELKARLGSRDQSYQSAAKRPRLSIVGETRSAKTVLGSTSNYQDKNQKYSIRNFRKPSAILMSKFCCLQIDEIGSDIDHTKLLWFSRSLQNNPQIKRKYNIRTSPFKCQVPSKEVVSTIDSLFLQTTTLPTWSERKMCLQILTVLLTHNSYPDISAEVSKLLDSFRESEEHTVITRLIHSSTFNIFTLCSKSYTSCPITQLFRFEDMNVILVLLESIQQLETSLQFCCCSNKMIQYVTCRIIEDQCLKGNMLSDVIDINEPNLLICLKLLCSLSPCFPDLSLSLGSQSIFFSCLTLLKKCPHLSTPGLAMVDMLHEAVFDSNNSMSM